MNNSYSPKPLNCNKNVWTNETESLSSSYDKFERSMEKLAPYDNSYAKLFELSNSKAWNKYSKNAINARSKNNNKMNETSSTIYNSLKDSNNHEKKPKLLRVREFNLEEPKKMMAEVKKIEVTEHYAFLETLPLDDTRSSVSSLTEVIESLDTKIKKLEMQESNQRSNFPMAKTLIENADKINPILNETKYRSFICTPRKNVFSQLENNDDNETGSSHENFVASISQDYESFVNERNLSDDENVDLTEDLTEEEKDRKSLYESGEFLQDESSREEEISMNQNESEDDSNFDGKTSRNSRIMPIMESTRKMPHSNSTKIKFPTPNRVDPNSLSSIGVSEIEDESRSINHDYTLDNAFCQTLPDEVEHFLEDAIGDEILNCTNETFATSDLNRDRTNSHFTASELISRDTTPLRQRIVQLLEPPILKPIHKYSSTLDRSMEVYRSISRKIKKKFQSEMRAEEAPSMVPNLPSGAQEKKKLRHLLQEANVQQSLINQATKALNVCHSMKEFVDSLERIESERLLLLANLRKKCVVEEIKRITGPGGKKPEKNCSGQRAGIRISEIKLNLQVSMYRGQEMEEMVDWFVVVVSQGLEIWATQPMSYERIRDSKISFPEEISISKLSSNFKILVEVYTMKVRKTYFNHEDKYHIRNEQKKTTSCIPCLKVPDSPTKYFKKIEPPFNAPDILHGHLASRNHHTTAFVLSGFVQLFLQDLTLPSPWPLLLVPESSRLHGTIDLNLDCRLHLSVNHEGFITDGDEAGGFLAWNRRWCVLKGHTLMFWNYPADQESKEPVKIIDLINCLSSKITTADRTICAKPRTLFFETSRPKKSNDRDSMIFERPRNRTIRHLMSLDCVNELEEWSTKLNHVIMALREWNVISIKN